MLGGRGGVFSARVRRWLRNASTSCQARSISTMSPTIPVKNRCQPQPHQQQQQHLQHGGSKDRSSNASTNPTRRNPFQRSTCPNLDRRTLYPNTRPQPRLRLHQRYLHPTPHNPRAKKNEINVYIIAQTMSNQPTEKKEKYDNTKKNTTIQTYDNTKMQNIREYNNTKNTKILKYKNTKMQIQ